MEAPHEEEVIDEANIGLANSENTENPAAVKNPIYEHQDTTNPLGPVKVSEHMLEKTVWPENYTANNDFSYTAPKASEIYGAEQ